MRSNRWTASTTALRKAQVRKKLLLGNSSAGLRYNVKLLYITQSPSPIAKNLSVVPSLAWHLAGILPSKAREGGGKGENWPMNMHGDMMGNREGGGWQLKTDQVPVFKATHPERGMWIAPNISAILKTPTQHLTGWRRTGHGEESWDEGKNLCPFAQGS